MIKSRVGKGLGASLIAVLSLLYPGAAEADPRVGSGPKPLEGEYNLNISDTYEYHHGTVGHSYRTSAGEYVVTAHAGYASGSRNASTVVQLFVGSNPPQRRIIPTSQVDMFSPELTNTSQRVVVSWIESVMLPAGDYSVSVMTHLFATSGAGTGTTTRISGWRSPAPNSWQNKPEGAVLNGGRAVLVWNVAVGSGELKYAVLAPNGSLDGPVRSVPGTGGANDQWGEGKPSVVPLKDGGFLVIYASGESGLQIFAQRFDAAGKAVGARRMLTRLGNLYSYDAAVLSNGNVMVAGHWTPAGGVADIYAQILSPDGDPVGPARRLGVTYPGFGLPAIASFRTGGAVIAYEGVTSANGKDIYGRILADDGRIVAGNFRVNTTGSSGHQEYPSVATYGEKFLIGWNGSYYAGYEAGYVGFQAVKRAWDASLVEFGRTEILGLWDKPDRITGSIDADVIRTFGGDDFIDGRQGADTMEGGDGNDTYMVDNPGDTVVEKAGGGTDTVRSTISYTLPAFVENLELIGNAPLEGTGNGLANTIIGNARANLLRGLAGPDILIGGLGRDQLEGGPDADTFRYRIRGDSARGTQRDLILDYQPGVDRIDLWAARTGTSAAGRPLRFIGEAAFSKVPGQIRSLKVDLAGTASDLTRVQVDLTGDGVADMEIDLAGGFLTLTQRDFRQ